MDGYVAGNCAATSICPTMALLRAGRDEGKPYVVVFTVRGETMWIISFRRARDRERKSYGKEKEA